MNNDILEVNLRALANENQELYSRITSVNMKNKKNNYSFSKSRSGETVPSYSLSGGNSKPLHSMVDPKREAERLVSTIADDTGFIVFLGLGGGFAPQTALEQTTAQVLVIDFDIEELFFQKDYTALLENARFNLLADPSCEEIKNHLLDHYRPSLCGGIKTIPLRARTEISPSVFEAAAEAIQEAIKNISFDYSVQAHFGMRWFSNIIRNIKFMETAWENSFEFLASGIQEAAIVAAGPSLDQQMPALAEKKSRQVFIICSDTAFPVLIDHGIEPDAVVSIDCQHISYYHFIGRGGIPRKIPLILDLASPPLLSSFSLVPSFFSSGHPLAQYVSKYWRYFPRLDTSGGNVTYACLSLAETLGVQRITLFGADFSYVNSSTYARGTYIFPFFEKKQNRFSPAEALFSAFLYRSPFIPPEDGAGKNYHETSSLRFYRKKLEEKAASMNAQISCAKGFGAPVNLCKTTSTVKQSKTQEAAVKVRINSTDFLEQYRNDIAALPPGTSGGGTENYLRKINEKDRLVFFTLLPCVAAVKHRNQALKTNDLIEETKRLCMEDISRVLSANCQT